MSRSSKPLRMQYASIGAVVAVILTLGFPSPASAGQSRYQAGNLFCNGSAHDTRTQSSAKGDVSHRIDYENSTNQIIKRWLGSSSFTTLWITTFTSDRTGGFWSYGDGSTGTVTEGSLSRWCVNP